MNWLKNELFKILWALVFLLSPYFHIFGCAVFTHFCISVAVRSTVSLLAVSSRCLWLSEFGLGMTAQSNFTTIRRDLEELVIAKSLLS